MNERSIFTAALDIANDAERAAFLDNACNNDAALRGQIDDLLAAEAKLGSFLVKPPPGLDETVERAPNTERPGTTIGPYKLLQQIGEGGMGTVWMAEQQEPVRRLIALKVIKAGMDSTQVIARFEAERQALALMDHPHIAKVFDGGTTASGRPFFVMELVKGTPITKYCDEQRLPPRQRLELFMAVCQALQHAHQKGIIHRDIKPSNVLVAPYDGKPVVKVIDFGVAKAAGQKLTDRTLFTEFGAVVGTLEYMSPEQAELNNQDIDTRSDIYSLGVLLYELLTGTTPLTRQRVKQGVLLEMLRLIREEEPPRPSTRLSESKESLPSISAQRQTDAAKLANLMRGELDWIVMKSLEKDRGRRYETANALARDVDRYLKDEQVEACPPTLGYRLAKYVRKHKAFLSTMSAVAAVLLIGIATTSWQAIRATDAEIAALIDRDEKEKARKREADQRAVAEAERIKAEKEKDIAQTALRSLRRSHYGASMNLIGPAWAADNLKRVAELLDEQRPKPENNEDLRGFEWHYWDRLSRSEQGTETLGESVHPESDIAISGDGSRIAYVASVGAGEDEGDRMVRVLDAKGKLVKEWLLTKEMAALSNPDKGPMRPIISGYQYHVVLNQHGSQLALVVGRYHNQSKVFAWKVSGGGKDPFLYEGKFQYPLTHSRPLAQSSDGTKLALVESENSVKVWDTRYPASQPNIIPVEGAMIIEFSPDGKRLATVIGTPLDAKLIQIWEIATGKMRANTTVSTISRFTDIAFNPTGERLVGAGITTGQPIDFHNLLWDGANGDELKLRRSTQLNEAVKAMLWSRPEFRVAFSPDDRCIALWSENSARILDADTGAVLPFIRVLKANALSLAFSADGTRLTSLDRKLGANDPPNVPGKKSSISSKAGPGSKMFHSQGSIAIVKELDVRLNNDSPRELKMVTVRSRDGEYQAMFEPFKPATKSNPAATPGKRPKGGLLLEGSGGEVTIRDRAGNVMKVPATNTRGGLAGLGDAFKSLSGKLCRFFHRIRCIGEFRYLGVRIGSHAIEHQVNR